MDRPDRLTRRAALASVGAGIASAAGCLGGGDRGGASDPIDEPYDPDAAWVTAPLTDVRTGEEFTVADLPTPLLLETFAVWCSKCLSQQREIRTLHDRRPEVTSVALNVDPNEDDTRVRSHLEDHGFDWRYAVSPPMVTDSLVERFGSSMTVPPRAPVVVVCDSTARRLGDGVKSADALATAVENCP